MRSTFAVRETQSLEQRIYPSKSNLPEVPPLCRETQSLEQQMLNSPLGINGLIPEIAIEKRFREIMELVPSESCCYFYLFIFIYNVYFSTDNSLHINIYYY